MVLIFSLLGLILVLVSFFLASEGRASAFILVGVGLALIVIGADISADQNKKEWMDKCIQHELEYKCEALYR